MRRWEVLSERGEECPQNSNVPSQISWEFFQRQEWSFKAWLKILCLSNGGKSELCKINTGKSNTAIYNTDGVLSFLLSSSSSVSALTRIVTTTACIAASAATHDCSTSPGVPSVDQSTNALNKIQLNTDHKIQFMTYVKLLRFWTSSGNQLEQCNISSTRHSRHCSPSLLSLKILKF